MLSLFLSFSSSPILLDDLEPQICISISAKRFSSSHCCWLSFTLIAAFSVSTVWRRSRSLLISDSRASCELRRGVVRPDISWVILSHWRVVPVIKIILTSFKIQWCVSYPLSLKISCCNLCSMIGVPIPISVLKIVRILIQEYKTFEDHSVHFIYGWTAQNLIPKLRVSWIISKRETQHFISQVYIFYIIRLT